MAKLPASRPANEEVSIRTAIFIVMGIIIVFVLACVLVMYIGGYFDAIKQ